MKSSSSILRVISGTLLLLISNMLPIRMSSADFGKITPPDFAFPNDVATASKTTLDSILSAPAPDGQKVLRSLIDYVTARLLVSNDNLNPVYDDITSVEAQLADPVDRALSRILQADILGKYYGLDSYNLNNRTVASDPIPADIALWSGDQIREKIRNLLSAALEHSDALKAVSVADYSTVISADDLTRGYYPTLFDFAATRAMDILAATSGGDDANSRLQSSILESLIEFHASDIAPFINYTLMSDRYMPFNSRMNLYRQFESTDFSGQILTVPYFGQDNKDKTEYAAALRSNISRFPNFWVTNELKNQLAQLTAGSISANISPAHPIPGKEFAVRLNIANVNDCVVEFYPIGRTDKSDIQIKDIPASSRPISVTFSAVGEAPFRIDTIIRATLPSAGCYAMLTKEKGKNLPPRYSVPVIEASALYGVEVNNDNNEGASVIAVNSLTGTPVAGVKADFNYTQWKNGRNTAHTIPAGVTDKAGVIRLSQMKQSDGTRWGSFVLSSGEDRFRFQGNYPGKTPESPEKDFRLSGYTDRAIYRPDDEVRFAFVISESEKDTHRLISAGQEISVKMNDANFRTVDSILLTTDEFGRVAGSMTTPTAGLTGQYSLVATVVTEDKAQGRGYAGFTVSDYKLPTFRVEVTSVKRDYPASGDVTLSGSVKDFTGFPMGGAALTVKLSTAERLRWWWSSPAITKCTLDTVADAEGRFSVTFGRDILSGRDDYCATIDATSSTGETRSATKYFTTGKPYIIAFSTPENIDASQPVKLNVKVLNDEYLPAPDIPMTFTLTSSDGKGDVSGTFTSSATTVDWRKVREGRYTLEIATADTTLAAPQTSEVVIYRPADKRVAVDVPLWIPSTTGEFRDGKARILYGVGSGKSHIYVFKKSGIYSDYEIHEATQGYHYLEIDNPAPEEEKMALVIFTVREGQLYSYTVTLNNPAGSTDINVSVESFRDKLVPGSEETWVFKVKSAQGQATRSALLLDVYNSALAQLAPLSYRVPSFPHKQLPYLWLNYNGSSPSADWYAERGDRLPVTRLMQPEFIDYGHNFGFMHLMRTSNMMLKMASPAMMDRATASGVNAADMDGAELAEEEVAEAADVTAEAATEESDEDGASPRSESDFRPSELPVMMFRPMLTTDADGTCKLTFTVPNANASWEMLLVAYTERLQSTMTTRSFITSKPVMVTANLPRFLRVGDSALIPAMVKNNTDSTSTAEVTVELFNPADGKVYDTVRRTITLAPMTSDTVGITISVNEDMNMTGYRVRATAGRYSDGEQAAIPVLPSAEPVVESRTFFLSPDEKEFSIDVPKLAGDTKATLLYCDNPRWWVVSALPGLRKNAGNDANSAAAAIYSAEVATHIIDSNPAVKSALEDWLANPSDSMLVSMLSRNPELKISLLTDTPWVGAAESDTERMTRLALLFDKKEVTKTIASATEQLSKLHATDGGWMWFTGATRPSSWVTLNVLGMMGDLREMGVKPSAKLADMINSSLKWLDSEMVKSAKTSNSPAGFVNYTYIRSKYSDIPATTEAEGLMARVKEYLVANWKKLPIGEKAEAALVLNNGGYPRVARQILESLRQYSRTSPEKGTWFPSLDDIKPWWPMTKNIVTAEALKAFATIDPGCKDSEGLAQWLVMHKEAQNWGTSVATTQVISALLDTYRMPLRAAGTVTVTIGGEEVTPSRIESLTGDFSLSLAPYSPSGKTLGISRSGRSQATGALITSGMADPKSVKAASCDALSVEKSLQRRVSTPEGFIWENTDSLSTGDRVQVTLLIRTTRDLQYVTVTDNRAAAFEPVDQLPGYVASEGVMFYRENRDAATNLFIDYLPAGTYLLRYELNVNTAGRFTSGIATAQSQYSPSITAHSSGTMYEIH